MSTRVGREPKNSEKDSARTQRTQRLAETAFWTLQTRLMQEATQAAPKPLSMLTTVTLEAQELSMPSNAATRPNRAPWPTLGGTATTGAATSPPTSLGST